MTDVIQEPEPIILSEEQQIQLLWDDIKLKDVKDRPIYHVQGKRLMFVYPGLVLKDGLTIFMERYIKDKEKSFFKIVYYNNKTYCYCNFGGKVQSYKRNFFNYKSSPEVYTMGIPATFQKKLLTFMDRIALHEESLPQLEKLSIEDKTPEPEITGME